MARVTATVELGTPDPPAPAVVDGAAPPRSARVHLDGRWQEVPVVARDGLATGAGVEGPALVVQPTATTVLEAGDVLTVDSTGHMIITWGRA